MKTFAIAFFTLAILYTWYCAANGPPYHDAYGEIIRAAYCNVSTCR
jgi:hypothetical protein